MFICKIFYFYLLIGFILFLIYLNKVLTKHNLKISDLKKFNFKIRFNGKRYSGFKAYLIFIISWPLYLNFKNE